MGGRAVDEEDECLLFLLGRAHGVQQQEEEEEEAVQVPERRDWVGGVGRGDARVHATGWVGACDEDGCGCGCEVKNACGRGREGENERVAAVVDGNGAENGMDGEKAPSLVVL